jgi:hypothetical protein
MERSSFTFQSNDSLDQSSQKAFQTRRPILTHLNADTSWLLQLPYPEGRAPRTGRSRYNIVIDPWFQGPQIDIAPWFSKQCHASKSGVQTFQELEGQLENVERVASLRERGHEAHQYSADRKSAGRSMIDAVIISHEFTDHCHKETLLGLDPAIPVFATKKAASMIRSWKYFSIVSEIPIFAPRDTDWKNSSTEPLPDWLRVFRVVSKSDSLYLHSAVVITFGLNPRATPAATSDDRKYETLVEAVVYTPHGTQPQDLRQLQFAQPPITTLALLHGLHQVILSPITELNLGGHNGLQAQRLCKAKYWISTHDEIKKGTGLVASLLKRKVIGLQEAIEQQQSDQENPSRGSCAANIMQATFVELSAGEGILLE